MLTKNGRALVKQLIWLPVLAVCVACQSESTNGVGSQAGLQLPLSSFGAVDEPQLQTQSRLTRKQLINPEEPAKTSVRLINAEGLGSLSDEPQISGWQSQGNCGKGNVELQSGGGKRGFLTLSNGCVLTQSTSATISQQALSLRFSFSAARDFANAGASAQLSLNAELLAIDQAGTAQTIAAEQYTLSPDDFDWQARQLLITADQYDAVGDAKLAVRFSLLSDQPQALYLSDVALGLYDANDSMAASNSNAAETGSSSDTAREDNANAQPAVAFKDTWAGVCEQAWVGGAYWANRIHDWEVTQGRLQTRNATSQRPLRSVHRLNSVMSASPESFELGVNTGVVGDGEATGFSGILIGAGGNLDYRAAALIHNRPGRDGGLIAGVDPNGRAFIHDNGVGSKRIVTSNGRATDLADSNGVSLLVRGEYSGQSQYLLRVSVLNADGIVVNAVSTTVPAHRLIGNIALVSTAGLSETQHWFNYFYGAGAKLIDVPERSFGPVLMSTYTLSKNTLTLNAQLPQLCVDAYETPSLDIKRNGEWQSIAFSDIDPAAFVSRFTVADWTASEPMEYRVSLRKKSSEQSHYYYGVVQADPIAKDDFVLSTFNCRPGVLLSDTEGWIQQNNTTPFTWTQERIAYPHSELLANADKHNSDMLAFLGDQIYEFDPNGLIDDENLENLVDDYFWKWQQFVFSVREYTRNTPAFIIPDDHDVYQGNVWGANGIPAVQETDGGFVYPSEFVQIVIKTQTGSLPTHVDNAPVEQGIDVYFTDLVYGGVGIAVLEDRKFKSAPGTPEDAATLLGNRQLDFLTQWAKDWEGQTLKLAISQSPFAQSTTHAGAEAARNLRDNDANGWPKPGRDRAVSALRKAFAPHVSGDQHLGLTLQHGVDQPNDGVFSFAGPSMLNIFPRVWDPSNLNAGPGDPAVDYLGQHTDAHGNLINVLAAANPDSYYLPRPPNGTWQKDQLGIGYGVVRMHKAQRSYSFEAWPAWVNPETANLEDGGAGMYSDWPITVSQIDNDGRQAIGFLLARTTAVNDAVVSVTNQTTGELVYARRIIGNTVELPVYDAQALYTVELSDSASGYYEVFNDQSVEKSQ